MCIENEVMVSRVTLILYVLQSRGAFWLYEQPGSSLLWYHPRMEEFLKTNNAWRCWTWMGAWGGSSPKGTTLWSSSPDVRRMSRVLPDKVWRCDMTRKTTLASGKLSVSGGTQLKESQAYTAEFGYGVLSTWLSREKPVELDFSSSPVPNIWSPLSKRDRWDDARLSEVMQYLTV